MKKTTILTTIAGGLMAASLALAGPASAHHGDAGDGSGVPGGGIDRPACLTCAQPIHHLDSADQQIGVGIFTAPQPVESRAAVGIYNAPAPVADTPAGSAQRVSAPAVGSELPIAPVGAAPAA